jgi:hypothetical protein
MMLSGGSYDRPLNNDIEVFRPLAAIIPAQRLLPLSQG